MNVRKEMFDQLREMFDGIPESCFYLNIVLEVGKPVVIETKFYPEEEMYNNESDTEHFDWDRS